MRRRCKPPQPTAHAVEPGGTFFIKNPALGYTHIPGAYTVTLADGYSFHVTHLPSTLRVTHPVEMYSSAGEKDGIWILGCSFTYGWAIEDHETYAWRVQESFPEYEVVNFGCSGYGTLHGLIQLREALVTGKAPKVVVLAYASFHDARNTFLRKRRKSVAPWNSLGPLVQPYASLDSDGKLRVEMADVEYREFPLMRRSSLAHFVEMTYNNVEAVPTVDISVDMSIAENTNHPHDGHPSALAHRHYASTLEPVLRGLLSNQTAKP